MAQTLQMLRTALVAQYPLVVEIKSHLLYQKDTLMVLLVNSTLANNFFNSGGDLVSPPECYSYFDMHKLP